MRQLAGLLTALLLTTTALSVSPTALPTQAAAASLKVWLGREAAIEAHLRTAEITSLEEIGTGVTRPRRGRLQPQLPFGSLVWKPLPPGRKSGYWESHKSEIAAYELDRLLELRMVPPAVERQIGREMGAAIMWIDGSRSVKQEGGQVPSSAVWGPAIRRMVMFDNLIGNPDRNAGNILLGPPGEFILIDHSRAFVNDKRLVKFERVDEGLWERMKGTSAEDLRRVLEPWIDKNQIAALLERRGNMIANVDRLVKSKGRAAVIIP